MIRLIQMLGEKHFNINVATGSNSIYGHQKMLKAHAH
jgi:hypothetical protein